LNEKIIKITPFLNGINIGKTIAASGSLHIMEMLKDSPKYYTELFKESQLSTSTFYTSISKLVENKIITNNKKFYHGKKNSQYALTSNGKELLKIIKKFERELTLDPSQKKLIDK
jgi:DNA-binding HxlR family transcriptional regulator